MRLMPEAAQKMTSPSFIDAHITEAIEESTDTEAIDRYNLLRSDLQSMRDALHEKGSHLHQNDRANIDVPLFTAERMIIAMDVHNMESLPEADVNARIDSAKKLLRTDHPFHHKRGSHMRGYYSEIDGSLQGYAILVPEKYDSTKASPLVVNLHGYDPGYSAWWENAFLPGFNPNAYKHDDLIFVNPFGRGNTIYQDIGEHDVLRVIEEMQRLYNIDSDRIYLTGGSMGGGGTWHIGLRYADKFAAIAPIMGPTEYIFWAGPYDEQMSRERRFILDRKSPLSYAENALHLPVFCNHGVLDEIVPVQQSRRMVRRLNDLGYDIKYIEHPEAEHGGFDPLMEDRIFSWFENYERDPSPSRVVMKAGSLKDGDSYWVHITRFIDQLQFATIDARVRSRIAIQILTRNIAEFRITCDPALIDAKAQVRVSIDNSAPLVVTVPGSGEIGFRAGVIEDGIVRQWSVAPAAGHQTRSKNAAICGPISDAFNSAFMLVYGSIGDDNESAINEAEAHRFARQWYSWQHVFPRMKRDVDITEEDKRMFNLILFGGPSSNSMTAEYQEFIPFRFENGKIIAGNRIYSGNDIGLAMVALNPEYGNRYIVIYAGVTWPGTHGIIKRIGSEFDYVIFDDKTMGINALQGNLTIDGTPLLCGFFNQDWKLSERYQFHADQTLRDMIVPRRILTSFPSSTDADTLFLSDLNIIEVEQDLGMVELDRTFWGHTFQVEGEAFYKGLGVFPNSSVTFKLPGDWNTLHAVLKADANPYGDVDTETYAGGKIQFGIYGDNLELFTSDIMDINSKPQEISVDIKGIQKLRLIVRTQDWLPWFAQSASWINATLIR
jgi:predicted peptidase